MEINESQESIDYVLLSCVFRTIFINIDLTIIWLKSVRQTHNLTMHKNIFNKM